ncbi:hypothetical protein SAMN05421854_110102 [Amycolatopsis rubida]|uniref:Uncharacterized protein n=1 Tax=Amycolatopsis rubida TaxID=112413 RepID=A0A1I5X999_9PSEU|nr:hypothetical protein SAMN05421854_110102 [Amycolatopsis rubida]
MQTVLQPPLGLGRTASLADTLASAVADTVTGGEDPRNGDTAGRPVVRFAATGEPVRRAEVCTLTRDGRHHATERTKYVFIPPDHLWRADWLPEAAGTVKLVRDDETGMAWHPAWSTTAGLPEVCTCPVHGERRFVGTHGVVLGGRRPWLVGHVRRRYLDASAAGCRRFSAVQTGAWTRAARSWMSGRVARFWASRSVTMVRAAARVRTSPGARRSASSRAL